MNGVDDAAPLIAEAVWEGFILDTPRGAGGFGYDPYFWLPELGLTAAQLDPEEKNRLSHRGRAMRALRDQLRAPGRSPVRAVTEISAATELPLALYVHMPWCVRKCPYCDFNSHQLKSGRHRTRRTSRR